MIAFPAGVKVWIAGGVTDMRRRQRFLEPMAQPLVTMNTLALQVQEGLGRDPHAGEIFCFRGRKGACKPMPMADTTISIVPTAMRDP